MNAFLRFLLVAAALWVPAAQAADTRQARPAAGFHAIALSAPVKLEVVQGDTEGLVLEGDEFLLADIESGVENGVLRIRVKPGVRYFDGRLVRGTVNARRIDGLSISGSGDIAAAKLATQDLAMSISGSGDLRIGALTATRVDANISGSGDIEMAGRAERLALKIAGSGDVRAAGLESREASVSIAGSGDARVWARDQLQVRIAGSGDVRYRGEPRVQPSILGSGTVKRLPPG